MTSEESDRLRMGRPDSGKVGRTDKTAHLVARRILGEIVAQGLTDGARLPSEQAMLESFGVSRGTLREALRVLETLGLIRLRAGAGGGPSVAGASSRDLGRVSTLYFYMAGATYRELAEARLALEPLAVRLAAERTGRQASTRLAEAMTEVAEVSVADDTHWARAANEFHAVAAGMSGNRVLDLLCQAIEQLWSDRVIGAVYPADERQRIQAEHGRIAAAVDAGDAELAESLMRDHMEEWLEYVSRRQPDFLDEPIDWR